MYLQTVAVSLRQWIAHFLFIRNNEETDINKNILKKFLGQDTDIFLADLLPITFV